MEMENLNRQEAITSEAAKRSSTDTAEEEGTALDSVKRTKTSPEVLIFSARHDKFARLELLPSNSLYSLIQTLCKHTPIGYGGSETADSHMWNITFRGKRYESDDIPCISQLRAKKTKLGDLELSEKCEMLLTYDYGSTSEYTITFEGSRDMEEGEDETLFPRNKPKSTLPASYVKFVTENNGEALNLDTLFPHLQKHIFRGGSVNFNLFQAGKKKHFGFVDKDTGYLRSMIYLPAKADNLTNWLKYFEEGAKTRPDNQHNWHSVVLLPRSQLTQQLLSKYKSVDRERGFCDVINVLDENHDSVTKAFPRIAAFAGCKKDKKVPKGWISFSKRGGKCDLILCTGLGKEVKSNAPKGTAWVGDGKYEPDDQPLFQVSGIEITGLHDLFCVVEGLLRTL